MVRKFAIFVGILDKSKPEIMLPYEAVRKKFMKIYTLWDRFGIPQKFKNAIPNAEHRLIMTLFFLQPAASWEYYLEWRNASNYIELKNYSVAQEKAAEIEREMERIEREDNWEKQTIGRTDQGRRKITMAAFHAGGLSKQEMMLLTNYNKQIIITKLLLFVIWCTQGQEDTTKLAVECMQSIEEGVMPTNPKFKELDAKLDKRKNVPLNEIMEHKELPPEWGMFVENAVLGMK